MSGRENDRHDKTQSPGSAAAGRHRRTFTRLMLATIVMSIVTAAVCLYTGILALFAPEPREQRTLRTFVITNGNVVIEPHSGVWSPDQPRWSVRGVARANVPCWHSAFLEELLGDQAYRLSSWDYEAGPYVGLASSPLWPTQDHKDRSLALYEQHARVNELAGWPPLPPPGEVEYELRWEVLAAGVFKLCAIVLIDFAIVTAAYRCIFYRSCSPLKLVAGAVGVDLSSALVNGPHQAG